MDIVGFNEEMREYLSDEKFFGDRFVEANQGLCTIIINGKEYELNTFIEEEKDNFNNSEIFEIELKGINNITDFTHMFCGCYCLSSLPDFHKINISKITNLSGMFSGCIHLKKLPNCISQWNTENITNMSALFYRCRDLEELPDISKWDTSNV